MGRKAKFDADGVEKVVGLYRELKVGKTKGTDVVGQIAEKEGVSKQSIYSALRKGGIHKPRAQGEAPF